MLKKSDHKLLLLPIIFLSGFLLCWGGSVIGSHLMVALTPSTSHRVYWLKSGTDIKPLKKGDYVVFRLKLDERYFSDFIKKHGDTVLVVKKVVCLPGDKLEVKNRQFFCNGVYLGTAKTHSLKGIPTKIFTYNGNVPEGHLFVMGSNINSYDSRYFGFIKKSEVMKIAVPII